MGGMTDWSSVGVFISVWVGVGLRVFWKIDESEMKVTVDSLFDGVLGMKGAA